MSDSIRLAGQQMLNTQLQNRINEYIRTVGTLQQSNLWLQKENNRLQQELARSKGQSLPQKSNAGAQPLVDQQGIEVLQARIKELELTLAEWMVSQKAFKEVVIQLGISAGLSHKEVLEKAQMMKMQVLENSNPQEHGTNADGVPLIGRHADQLRRKLSEQR